MEVSATQALRKGERFTGLHVSTFAYAQCCASRLPSHLEDDLVASQCHTQERRARLADEIKELVSQREEINKTLATLRAQQTAVSDHIHRLTHPRSQARSIIRAQDKIRSRAYYARKKAKASAEGGKEVAVGSSAGADGHEARQEEEADACCVCLE